mgnify:CR=1 FL=1
MPDSAAVRPLVGVVVLTQGDRPDELARGIESVLAQEDVELDVVVVGNGWQPTGLPAGVRGIGIETNVGIPAGRNRGAAAVSGRFVFFLDDDARIPSRTFLVDAIALLGRNPRIGLIQPRLEGLDGVEPPLRWIPRMRKGDRHDSSVVFSCLEAAVLLPRDVYDRAGGWGDEFFYAHEGIELAWRVWDQGRVAWYAGDLVAEHPVVHPTRHTDYYRLNARNRVWLARRNLPLPLVPLYVGSWTAVTLLRWWRMPNALRAWFGGWADGRGSVAPCRGTRSPAWRAPAALPLSEPLSSAVRVEVMPFLSDARKAVRLLRRTVATRSASRELSRTLSSRPTIEAGRYKIAVCFADGNVNMYQIRQWYKPLAVLAERWPVLVLSRGATAAATLLEESPLPVAYVRTVVALEQTLAEQDIRIVFYVNQNARNFQMFRYGRRWHVFINHGESDKMYMTTNQFKAYDYSLVAGDAAIARLGRALWDYDLDKRAIPIGRPQADHFSGTLPYTPDERTVVLYAPTWEGDRASAAYGSIATHGVALVRALLATGTHRVIFRPHPRSGVVDAAYGAAKKEIVAMIADANNRDAGAHHIYDDGPELGWQLSAADVAVVDISAMVYDRLATGKPLLVTRPTDPSASVDSEGYLTACEWLTAEAAPRIVEEADRLLHDEETVSRIDFWSRHYFGDPTPGEATRRFHAAVEHLMDEWERSAALHDDDGVNDQVRRDTGRSLSSLDESDDDDD